MEKTLRHPRRREMTRRRPSGRIGQFAGEMGLALPNTIKPFIVENPKPIQASDDGQHLAKQLEDDIDKLMDKIEGDLE